MPQPFNTVLHVVTTLNHNILSLLLHSCYFATVVNFDVNTYVFWRFSAIPVKGSFDSQSRPDPQVEKYCFKGMWLQGRTYKDKGKWAWRSEQVTFKHGGKEGQCQFQVRTSMLSLCGVRDPIQAFANSKKAPYQIGSIPSSWLPFWLTVSLPLARPQISSTLSRIVRN